MHSQHQIDFEESRNNTKASTPDVTHSGNTKKSPETAFLTKLFQQLNNNNIHYCVLRNYESLPYSLNGSDIDSLFSIQHFSNAHGIISRTAKEFGGKCILKLDAHRVKSAAFCGYFKTGWWGVRFDTFTYVGTNGCDILFASDVLRQALNHNCLRVANSRDDAIVAYIKEIIGSGRTRKDYGPNAVLAFSANKKVYGYPLKYFFGDNIFRKWLLPLLEGEKLNLRKAKSALRMGWLINMMFKHPIRTIESRIIDVTYRIYRIFKPLGFSCVVIGTDGSGKSTIIEGIRPPLESALHAKLNYEHMRPNLLPSIARLFGRQTEDGPVTNPHGSKPSGFLGSFLRLSYYSLDYILGHWFKVYPAKVKRPCLYVFDRYFYDFIIDPARSRISLPKWLIKLFAVLIPAPDLILCLGADPAVIQARKPELPLIEVERQVRELKKFCDSSPRAVWIDTAQPIEKSVDQTLETITDRMAARYE